MHVKAGKNPGGYDNLDYDNDNDNDNENGATGGPESNCLSH